jgi:hypothetical protein
MEKSIASVEVRVNGRPLREYLHKGEYWMEGRKGSDFTIRVRNKTWQRALAIVSIDGLSVMDGKEASYDSGGYVIEPNGYIDIPGWRLNDRRVAKFVFGKSAKSYAAKKDKSSNIGIIGCAMFLETGYTITYIGEPVIHASGLRSPTFPVETTTCYSANTVSSSSLFVEPSLGTEFGHSEDHHVYNANFVRANETPDELYEIRYADRSELERRGVDLKKKPVIANRPTAFPKEIGCKPPEGWAG